MEIVPTILKYGFVLAVAIELIIIGRAIFSLAREKAQATDAPVPTKGEQ